MQNAATILVDMSCCYSQTAKQGVLDESVKPYVWIPNLFGNQLCRLPRTSRRFQGREKDVGARRIWNRWCTKVMVNRRGVGGNFGEGIYIYILEATPPLGAKPASRISTK